ncbi:MAG: hypothetical protein K2W95_08715 [Candidatus Obscuribacterales bacterium]|nr:hypothetical protein [Candidatus Obscuribacterales bacterium]
MRSNPLSSNRPRIQAAKKLANMKDTFSNTPQTSLVIDLLNALFHQLRIKAYAADIKTLSRMTADVHTLPATNIDQVNANMATMLPGMRHPAKRQWKGARLQKLIRF